MFSNLQIVHESVVQLNVKVKLLKIKTHSYNQNFDQPDSTSNKH